MSTLGKALNVSQALEQGQISLDTDRRYLRFVWNVIMKSGGVEAESKEEIDPPPHWLGGPALYGLVETDSLIARLSSPQGGC